MTFIQSCLLGSSENQAFGTQITQNNQAKKICVLYPMRRAPTDKPFLPKKYEPP